MRQPRPEEGRRRFAVGAPLVVLAVHKGVLGMGVADQQHGPGADRGMANLQRAEVRLHEHAVAAEERGYLVEQAALDAGELVLRPLGDAREADRVGLDAI